MVVHARRVRKIKSSEQNRELFRKLADGQSPETLFITCSDSRISPNLITQTDPGELFVLRNAGNIVPARGIGSGEECTIEYAVSALGVRDIIVCGHTQCGAMKGLLAPESLTGLPAVARFLEHARATKEIVDACYGHLEGDDKLLATIEENVLVQIDALRTIPAVAGALSRGKLALHGWVYKFETGEIFAYNPGEGQYELLSQDSAPKPIPARAPAGPAEAASK